MCFYYKKKGPLSAASQAGFCGRACGRHSKFIFHVGGPLVHVDKQISIFSSIWHRVCTPELIYPAGRSRSAYLPGQNRLCPQHTVVFNDFALGVRGKGERGVISTRLKRVSGTRNGIVIRRGGTVGYIKMM